MKKILAMLLAVMMLLSVASVAMAEGDTATIKKNYTLENFGYWFCCSCDYLWIRNRS